MGSADPVPHAGPPNVAGVLPPEALPPAAPMDAAAAAGASSLLDLLSKASSKEGGPDAAAAAAAAAAAGGGMGFLRPPLVPPMPGLPGLPQQTNGGPLGHPASSGGLSGESTGAMMPGGMAPGPGGMVPTPGGGPYGYMPLPMGGYMPPPGHPSMGMAPSSQAPPTGGPPGHHPGMGGAAGFPPRWDGPGHPGTIMMMGNSPYDGQMMPGAMMMHGGMPMHGGGAMLGPSPGAMMAPGMHPMAGWGHPPAGPMVVSEPRPCWGHILSGGVSMCTPGFQGATGHFKNHFCPNCMLHGLCVEATRVRELVGDVNNTSFQNPRSHGLWATSGEITFRVINQTAKCSGAPIIITRDVRSAESLRLPTIPDHYLQDGWLHLSISRGTLIPTANLRGGNLINRTTAPPPAHLQPAHAATGHGGGVPHTGMAVHAGEALAGDETPPAVTSPRGGPAPYPGQMDGGAGPPPMAAARGAAYPSRVGPPTPAELGYPELGGYSKGGHSTSNAAPLPAPFGEGKAAAMEPPIEPDSKRARTDVPAPSSPTSHPLLPATVAGAGGEGATGALTSGVEASAGGGLAAVRDLASAHAQLVQQLQNVLQSAAGGKAQDPTIAAYQAALANFSTGIAPLSEAVSALGGAPSAGAAASGTPAPGS